MEDVVDMNVIKEETKKELLKEQGINEEDAYLLLLQIISYAQATKDYARFQSDLAEWKKRYFDYIEFFSDELKLKIKYMLSNEFLDTVLKNFVLFDELSKKDPSKGLEKLRKIFNKAENHKNSKELDSDLKDLFKEYPESFLKDKYPHIVSQILSKANRERVLQKFNSADAFKELENILSNPEEYKDKQEFEDTIEEWQLLFPLTDFKLDYQDKIKNKLAEYDDTKLEELFPSLDLSSGTVISLEIQPEMENLSRISKDALYDFGKIADKDLSDINALFDWTCKYSKYINSFDQSVKDTIVDKLMLKYKNEISTSETDYRIPKMVPAFGELMTVNDYNNLGDTKKQSVLQLLRILSAGKELTQEDNYRLNIINSNNQKVKQIEKSKIEQKLDWFIGKFPEDKLTTYELPSSFENSFAALDLEDERDIDADVQDENESFKDSLKILEPVEVTNSSTSSSSNNSTGSSGGGATGKSINKRQIKKQTKLLEDIEDENEDMMDDPEESTVNTDVISSSNFQNTSDSIIEAVVIETNKTLEQSVENIDVNLASSIDNSHENIPDDSSEITEAGVSDQDITEQVEVDTTQISANTVHSNSISNFFNRIMNHGIIKSSDDDRDDR